MVDSYATVAVVGGGIAGAASCLRLNVLGLDPLWISPAREDGDRPGEHLAPAARGLLQRIGAGHLLDNPRHREANSMISAWGSERLEERNSILRLQGPGIVVDRPAFERALVGLALTKGVRRIEAAVDAVSRDGRVWRLDADGRTMTAGFVIDASGRTAVLARREGRRFRADRLAALVLFALQDSGSDVEPTRATLIEAVADGWWYASLLADGRLALYYYTDPDLLPRDASREPAVFRALARDTLYVGRWIKEAGFRLETAPRLVSAGTTWIAPVIGTGWAAVGDAAAAFDPLSSFGMTTALWTAITASEAVSSMRAGDSEGLLNYAGKVAGGVQDFLDSRTKVYAAESRFADAIFWSRRRGISQRTASAGNASLFSAPCTLSRAER